MTYIESCCDFLRARQNEARKEEHKIVFSQIMETLVLLDSEVSKKDRLLRELESKLVGRRN